MTSIVTRRTLGMIVIGLFVIGAAVARLLVYRNLAGELHLSWPAEQIIWELRITPIVIASVVGASLAVSGVLLQALLRNPLASPFILGVSSGAALGVMIAMYAAERLGHHGMGGGSDAIPALIGAITTLAIVYTLGQRRGWLDPISLVLIGVIVSAMCGALIMFLQHLSPAGLRSDLMTWMMGHIRESVPVRVLGIASLICLVGMILAGFMGRAMDAAVLGDDEAHSVGLRIGRLRIGLFLLAGALASIAVALAGPIAFVGLIAPHAARLIIGPRHGLLVFGAAGIGIALLIGSDVAAQVISVRGGRMPVGVFTALLGGPMFIWLLRTGKGGA